ncbi:MAG TPA: peptidylprolyl isomerase [Candidatus Nanoarchaeia archaeon]
MNILTYLVNIIRNEPATLLVAVLIAAIVVLVFLIPSVLKHGKTVKKGQFAKIDLRSNKVGYTLAISVLVLAMISAAFSIWTNWDYVAGQLGFGPKIAAEVEGETIFQKDLDARVATQEYFYTNVAKLTQEEPMEIEDQVMEEMVQEILLRNLLAERGVTVTDSEVRQRIKETTVDRSFKGNWTAYENYLKSRYHTTLEEVMRTNRIELLKEKLGQLKTEKHILAIWVVKSEPQYISYAKMTDKQKSQHEKANKEKKEKANQVLQRVKNGEDFGKLAEQYSEDKKSAKNGGDLGFLHLPRSVEEAFQESLKSFPGEASVFIALEKLGVGEVKLYESFTGYTIVKVTEIKKGLIGDQSVDSWYKSYREKANVIIY